MFQRSKFTPYHLSWYYFQHNGRVVQRTNKKGWSFQLTTRVVSTASPHTSSQENIPPIVMWLLLLLLMKCIISELRNQLKVSPGSSACSALLDRQAWRNRRRCRVRSLDTCQANEHHLLLRLLLRFLRLHHDSAVAVVAVHDYSSRTPPNRAAPSNLLNTQSVQNDDKT